MPYGEFAQNLRGKKGQSGFTLIELLVVVTILGVLAAIVTLSLVGWTTNAEAKACEQEYKTVQSGLDAYKTYYNVDRVPASEGTSDMTTPVPLYQPAGTRTFIKKSPTHWAYAWNANGRITAIMQATGGPAVPSACTVSGS